jgi:bacterioferritin-associated ferredoxin
MKKCKHDFKSDGGQCMKCGKTATEIINEKIKKLKK